MLKTLLLITITTISLLNCADIPKIDVFVESLCPDCEDFIGGSFANYLQNPDYLQLAEVNFYPYGNANEKKVGDHYEFTCQHGSNECYGNVVEVCSLSKMSYEDGLEYMVCMEDGIRTFEKNINNALVNCVQDQNLLQSILNCALSEEGNLLQHNVAQKTPSNHKYVPWIQVNGVHDAKIEAALLENMNDYLCGLEGNSYLEGCQKKEDNSQVSKNLYKNFNSLTQNCPNLYIIEGEKFLN